MPWRFNPFTGNLDETDIPAFNGEVTLGSAASPSIFFTGDTNTGIYSPGADQLALSTNGTGRLFVDASGNVGVGSISTSSFQSASSTVLSLRDTATGNVASLKVLGGVGAGAIAEYGATNGIGFCGTSGAHDFTFYTNSAERLRITSAGLVGIGTSAPSNTLHVVGTGRFNVSGANNALIASDGGDPFIYTEQAAGLKFGTNSAVRMTINSSGSVGIGTTSPHQALDIGGTTTSLIKFTPSNYGTGATDGAQIGVNFGGLDVWQYENNYLRFGTNSTERMRIDGSGRLLVGTSSARTVEYAPGTVGIAKLQVEGADGSSSQILITDTRLDGRNPQLAFAKTRNGAIVVSGDTLGSIGFFGDDGTDTRTWGGRITCEVDGTPGTNDMPGRLVFSTTADGASSPTERMIIKNNGNILVGSNSDAGFTFQVSKASGAAGFFNRNTDDGAVVGFGRQASLVGTISVTTTATAYNTSSDYRLKENVTPVTDGITRLQQLKPSRFNFIADPDTVVDGFIAHEVQTIVPEAITGEKDAVDDEGNPQYQGIDQSKLVPLLTAALQEAIGRIETLEAEVAALKAS